jgi:hypothetical protein
MSCSDKSEHDGSFGGEELPKYLKIEAKIKIEQPFLWKEG